MLTSSPHHNQATMAFFSALGLENNKAVTIQPSAGDDKAVVLLQTHTKKQNAPAKLHHKNLMRKEFCKMDKAVKYQVPPVGLVRKWYWCEALAAQTHRPTTPAAMALVMSLEEVLLLAPKANSDAALQEIVHIGTERMLQPG